MLTLSLKFKLISDYLAVLRLLPKPDIIKEDARLCEDSTTLTLLYATHHRVGMQGDSIVTVGGDISPCHNKNDDYRGCSIGL
jgi:hypothetical protein